MSERVERLRRRQHFIVPALDDRHGQVLHQYQLGTHVRWREKRPAWTQYLPNGKMRHHPARYRWRDGGVVAGSMQVLPRCSS